MPQPAAARPASARATTTRPAFALAATVALAIVALLMPLTGTATGAVLVEGTVVLEHGDDFATNRTVEYKVLDTGRQRYVLDGPRAADLREGQRLRLRGMLRGGTLLLGAGSTIESMAEPRSTTGDAAAGSTGLSGSSASLDASIAATTTSTLDKRVAVLLVNFLTPPPTPTPTPSPTADPSASPDPSLSPDPTLSLDPSLSPAPSPTIDPGPTAPQSASPDPTASPSAEPTASPSPEPTASPSAEPTASPSAEPTPTPEPTPPPTPWTRSQVSGIYFTNTRSVASYYSELSSGRMSVSGSVFGWYTLNASLETCDYYGFASKAREAATAAGVDLASFTNFVYAFPKVDACPWGGMGNVNGPYSWINGKPKMNLYVAVHELGHNFGTHHAATLSCTDEFGTRVPYSAICTSNEYGDPFDVMGGRGSYSSVFHTSNWARRLVGALTTADQQTVTLNGVYSVATVQPSGGQPRIVRVARPSGDYYYLEYRQPYGIFEQWAVDAPVVNGVSIRLAPNSQRVPSQLIDTRPGTTSFSDAPLGEGRSFCDPVGGIVITTLSVGSARATVHVQVEPDTIAPGAVADLAAGVSAAEAISLAWSAASDDMHVCGYRVERGAELVGLVGADSLAFVDRGLAQAIDYAYTVTPFDAAGNLGPPTSASAYLPDTTPPVAPAALSATQTGERQVSLAWTEASDNIGVVGFRVTRDGTPLVDTTELALDDTTVVDGWTYGYSVAAIDAAGNVGAAQVAEISLPDVTAPSAAGALPAAPPAASAAISWTHATDNVAVAGYNVGRDGLALATLDGAATSFVESMLAEGTYTYEVSPFDAAGHFGPPLTLTATVLLADTQPPSVPPGLTATALGSRYIRLTWQPSTDDRPGTIRYVLFRGTRRIALTTDTTYVDRPANRGTYRYRVRAIDVAGNPSAFSPYVSGQAVRRI